MVKQDLKELGFKEQSTEPKPIEAVTGATSSR